MPQTYRFQVSLPVLDLLPRNRWTNVLHFEHSLGGLTGTDLSSMCGSIADLYTLKYGRNSEVQVKAYEITPPPNYPKATVTRFPGVVWPLTHMPELALCLSFAGSNRGNKRERGRIYLSPQLQGGTTPAVDQSRPSSTTMDWALGWYSVSNASLPDLGGIDWKFGVYSRTGKVFTQTKQAWVNDEWDVQRRRGLRETTRVTSQRDG